MPHVFVSYAHQDEAAFREARLHLAALERAGRLTAWTDRQIPVGGDWAKEIERALAEADVGILLVTPRFLASEYITTTELPALLAKRVFWVPVSASGFRHSALANVQAAHDPERPLDTLRKGPRQKAWAAILDAIVASLQDEPLPVRAARMFGFPARNPLFTGRESELRAVFAALRTGDAALAPVAALHGMGGEGKTQTAVEYAYRHQGAYRHVFMVRAEHEGELEIQLAGLASPLGLPERDATETPVQTAAVLRWLGENGGWLLVVDNAERLAELRIRLPRHPEGRVLVTTREHVPARFGTRVEVDHLDDDTGATLLLRYAGRLRSNESLDAAPERWQEGAREVSRAVGGLALALGQAGAYVGEVGIRPDEYARLYETERQGLHPDPGHEIAHGDHAVVAVTFGLALAQVEAIPVYGEAAAQLIAFCAFLAPDAIPDEFFTLGSAALPEPLATFAAAPAKWMEVVKAATRHALIRRDPDFGGFTLHRLVADVIRDAMDEDERRSVVGWAHDGMREAFPEADYANWPLCERLLPHALALRTNAEGATPSLPTNRMAQYLQKRARYRESESLFREELAAERRRSGAPRRHLTVALANLGVLLEEIGRPKEAVGLLEEALSIHRTLPRADPLDEAAILDNLSESYASLDRLGEAEPLRRRALELTQARLGPDDPVVALQLNNLADLLAGLGQLEEAVACAEEAMRIKRATLDAANPSYAASLISLGMAYLGLGRHDAAEGLLRQAFEIHRAVYGEDHPDSGYSLFALGAWHFTRGQTTDALDLVRRALAIQVRFHGPDHQWTAQVRTFLEGVEATIHQAASTGE